MSKDITLKAAALLAETNPEAAALFLEQLGFTLQQARRLLFARWLAQTGRLSEGHQKERDSLDKLRLLSSRAQEPAEPRAALPEAA